VPSIVYLLLIKWEKGVLNMLEFNKIKQIVGIINCFAITITSIMIPVLSSLYLLHIKSFCERNKEMENLKYEYKSNILIFNFYFKKQNPTFYLDPDQYDHYNLSENL
jgi:hypothetical protein